MSKEWPDVTVLIITWNRPKVVRQVIQVLQEKLHYPGEIRWHLADDTSPGSYVADILRDFPALQFSHTITPKRSGWGGNVNMALRAMKTPYVFQIEDDQLALRQLDIESGVFVMQQDPSVGLVRYDGLEGHRVTLYMDETPKIKGRRVHFLRVRRKLTMGLAGYSNRPHLKHPGFHIAYGLYPEGFSLGSTEELFAWRVMHSEGPDVVALSSGIERAFRHMGKSRQATKEDIGRVVLWK